MMSDLAFIVAMGSPQDGTNPLYSLGVFAVIIAIFYFVLLLPMRKKQQKVQQFLDALKVGDRVITTGGIYGQVTKLGGDSLQLQIADKLRIEVAKASIGGYQGQAPVVEPSNE
jgi:preprotein translocase subunit YajC